MLSIFSKHKRKFKTNQELLKSKIFLIALAIVAWASYCSYLVQSRAEILAHMNLPSDMPPLYLFDIFWLIAYISLLVGLQVTAVKGVGRQKSWIVIVSVLLTGFTQVMMYVSLLNIQNMTLASVFNLLNTFFILIVFVSCWSISRIGALMILPYILLSGFTLYFSYFMIILN